MVLQFLKPTTSGTSPDTPCVSPLEMGQGTAKKSSKQNGKKDIIYEKVQICEKSKSSISHTQKIKDGEHANATNPQASLGGLERSTCTKGSPVPAGASGGHEVTKSSGCTPCRQQGSQVPAGAPGGYEAKKYSGCTPRNQQGSQAPAGASGGHEAKNFSGCNLQVIQQAEQANANQSAHDRVPKNMRAVQEVRQGATAHLRPESASFPQQVFGGTPGGRHVLELAQCMAPVDIICQGQQQITNTGKRTRVCSGQSDDYPRRGKPLKLSYINQLYKNTSSLLKKLGMHRTVDEQVTAAAFSSGLRKLPKFLDEREDQAIPMARSVLVRMVAGTEHLLARGLWLQWKTVSRWDEVFELIICNLRCLDEKSLFVTFSITKPHTKHRIDAYVRVEDQPDRIRWFWEGINHRKSLAYKSEERRRIWKEFPTSAVEAVLKKVPVLASDQAQMESGSRTHYTCHSIKRGAAQTLLQAANQGKLGLDRFQSNLLVSHMCKHKVEIESLTQNTGRYMQDKVLIADAMDTHLATRLL